MVKRANLSAAVIVILLSIPAPSLAQEEAPTASRQSSAALASNAPDPPDFALERDGDLVVGGDVVIANCPSLSKYFERYGEPVRDPEIQYELNVRKNEPEQTRALVKRCGQISDPEEDPTSGGGDPSAATLPESGGASLAFLAGTLIAGAGLVIHRTR